ENLAEAVWQTIELYGLKGRIQAVVADNASNNDTMVEALERCFKAENIPFHASHARMRCVPHTIHLAALELLQAIGGFSSTNNHEQSRGKYQATPDNYQEALQEPLTTEADNLLSQANDSVN
ncbi:hypothetical protein BKA93DRAFT_698480, partial [Sparassis latifolia]